VPGTFSPAFLFIGGRQARGHLRARVRGPAPHIGACCYGAFEEPDWEYAYNQVTAGKCNDLLDVSGGCVRGTVLLAHSDLPIRRPCSNRLCMPGAWRRSIDKKPHNWGALTSRYGHRAGGSALVVSADSGLATVVWFRGRGALAALLREKCS